MITLASTQAIVLANAADPTLFVDQVIRNNGFLEEVAGGNINAPSLETDGFDFGVNFQSTIPNTEFDWGVNVEATHILSYDIVESEGGPVIEAVGERNRNNIGVPTPDWRANATITASNSFATASLTGRYISSFTNDDFTTPDGMTTIVDQEN